ncbi:GDYXXLXY domain-containing protein [Winogradskyella sp.]|uniref:GDYXXLXY domain-containing protein n=1 Tax=Winogradskyella sp. TaxID=1883156 RepID=UPI0025D6E3C0|nr:GDYXXLXY domain-containing protein [Winogradskyella sp.]
MKTIHVFLIFIAVVILQLFVPAKMIFDKEAVLKTGTVYKFKTRPIDPSDPFRGKYVTLNYELNTAETMDSTLRRGDKILVYLETDSSGFAKLHSVSKTEKNSDRDFVEAKVQWYNSKSNSVNFQLEFNRYYMDEFKAKPAEDIYREYNRRRDTINKTYALVAVQDGEAVLKDVFINDKPILYYIEKQDNQ